MASRIQDELRRKWYLNSRKGHFSAPDVAGLSEEGSQLAVKWSRDRPVQPLFDQRLADR
jgi:hypothetical protein